MIISWFCSYWLQLCIKSIGTEFSMYIIIFITFLHVLRMNKLKIGSEIVYCMYEPIKEDNNTISYVII